MKRQSRVEPGPQKGTPELGKNARKPAAENAPLKGPDLDERYRKLRIQHKDEHPMGDAEMDHSEPDEVR